MKSASRPPATAETNRPTPKLPHLGKWKTRPLRNLSPEIVPFWEGLLLHEFRLCKCRRCGACFFPFTVCVHHADIPDFTEMEWLRTSGKGQVFAHLIVYNATDPDYADDVPFTLALVELDEGPLFPTRIVGCRPDDVKVGMRVGIHFEDIPEAGYTLPLFAPE
jgi:uncharacterized OB-fold protein